MKFFISILICIFTASSLFGYIQTRNDYGAQLKVFKELDIDPKYMKDPYFLAMSLDENNITKKSFVNIIKEEYSHISMLKELIKNSDMPKTFLYLAIVESGLSNKAVSNVRAVGMWQFMEGTAKIYGLKINKYVDERRDPVAATQAAVSYLKALKSQFGKWYLAIIAYNCGEGKLKKAIAAAGTDSLSVLVDPDKKYLSLETRMFIKKILLSAYMAEDSDFIISKDSSLLNNANQISITKIMVPGGTSLASVGDSIGLSLKKMKEFNAHLKFGFTPPNLKEYHMYIPISKKDLFVSNFKAIKSNKVFHVYKVKKGDTIAKIASKWGTNSNEIKKYNNITSVKANQEIVIPASKSAAVLSSYKVQKGDTLIRISKKFDVKISDILEANDMKTSNLDIGDSIVIPK
ncbi:membrane-bound lytic murein transglycosylase D [Campylobacter iguaniorum]|uniref:Membrane-bound lytic murein transglycosylase D n=1 Tax=Campylobacter iguaniorum TaxID=1244531 RepID=A0A076FBI9_9BACT|nr:lytic transglycosylase domain-containing protein [Campylobacter iguaniorum]AII15068.1 membrane-bound lytic murein transglycosylase D [Campylobacter iguaniorum]ALV24894.1 membrane-bound lytic murein transglycosylase D [Campylobacter iguaniorum]